MKNRNQKQIKCKEIVYAQESNFLQLQFNCKKRPFIDIETVTILFSYILVGQMTPIGGRKKLLNLPPFAQQPANIIEPETETRLQNIKERNGILNIDDVPYKTDIKDLEHLGELGNGTSGHVVKMRHKETGRIIAVKVNIIEMFFLW